MISIQVKKWLSDNVNTRLFLEAMGAWLEDTEGGCGFLSGDNGDNYITWADLFKLIQAAAVCE